MLKELFFTVLMPGVIRKKIAILIIDLVVISSDFKNMNIRERLEISGLAAGNVFEPIEALGYTPQEILEKKETFLLILRE